MPKVADVTMSNRVVRTRRALADSVRAATPMRAAAVAAYRPCGSPPKLVLGR
jgi:hypothetical protein